MKEQREKLKAQDKIVFDEVKELDELLFNDPRAFVEKIKIEDKLQKKKDKPENKAILDERVRTGEPLYWVILRVVYLFKTHYNLR